MATPTEPVTDAHYQALSSPEPDPQVVHAAIEEIRYLSGHNVISTIGAQLTEFRAELDTREARAANEALRRAGLRGANRSPKPSRAAGRGGAIRRPGTGGGVKAIARVGTALPALILPQDPDFA